MHAIRIDFFGIKKRRCIHSWIHIPHFWYDMRELRRFFCKGDDWSV